jgi:hypothetical protein
VIARMVDGHKQTLRVVTLLKCVAKLMFACKVKPMRTEQGSLELMVPHGSTGRGAVTDSQY